MNTCVTHDVFLGKGEEDDHGDFSKRRFFDSKITIKKKPLSFTRLLTGKKRAVFFQQNLPDL